MVRFGKVLQALTVANAPPDAELLGVADELLSISREELADVSQTAVQIQQQEQRQQQQQQQQQLPIASE